MPDGAIGRLKKHSERGQKASDTMESCWDSRDLLFYGD